ncbi:MAG: hypothetical protein DCC55_40625 [Chloroflexi bacterium]|nr:MAG: hypothetical protein DCC55_40625 [Chloroflexota bacterium]
MQNKARDTEEQGSSGKSEDIGLRVVEFLGPLLITLDEMLDKRLVRTFVRTVMAIITFRHGSQGLLLSELGGYILNPAQAPAGTKRLSNLLRSKGWTHRLIDDFLWQRGEARVHALKQAGEEALVVWDESVIEKAGSLTLEGLCSVRSSVARWLKRIKPGFYSPPSAPIFVPGMQWVGVLVIGMSGPPEVAAMHWWSTRGVFASDKRSEEEKLLTECVRRWGRAVLHVWDRGFAGAPWLGIALAHKVRFVLRWQKGYKLVDAQGRSRKAWQICRGKRSWTQVLVWDSRRRQHRKIGIYATPVFHPDYPDTPLWLIVSRQGKGRQPWYLLTNQPVSSSRQAWHFIRAYARRWQIEMAWRYSKSELAMESPRLWSWQNRLKLLLIATLAYAFLLSLLCPESLRLWLLQHWCPRTGKRCRDVSTPLYRLRSALSRLWLAYPPPDFLLPSENPG